MSVLLDIIIASCLTNSDSRSSQGCKSLVQAAYIQYHIENSELDRKLNRIADDLNNLLPTNTKLVIMTLDAINRQQVYINLVNKEF